MVNELKAVPKIVWYILSNIYVEDDYTVTYMSTGVEIMMKI